MTRVIIEDKGVEKNDIKAIGYHKNYDATFNIVILFKASLSTDVHCNIFYTTKKEVRERLRQINWDLGGIV